LTIHIKRRSRTKEVSGGKLVTFHKSPDRGGSLLRNANKTTFGSQITLELRNLIYWESNYFVFAVE
jgi:hypothetical protein